MWIANLIVADSEWWIAGVVAFAALILAYSNPEATWGVLFLLIIVDCIAYLDGVSLWWVLGVPVGLALLGILRVISPWLKQEWKKGSKWPQEHLPTHRTQERTPLLLSNTHPTQPFASSALRSVPPLTPGYGQGILITSRPKRQQEYTVNISSHVAHKIRESNARPEIDGEALHSSVTEVAKGRYRYDQQIQEETPRSTTRQVFGYFKCPIQTCRKQKYDSPRVWPSYKIIVKIWMSSDGRRYRTRLHSQMCLHCDATVEPEVHKDYYTTQVVSVLDRWTGHHSPVKPLADLLPTGPHKSNKCHACKKGICSQSGPKV